MEQLLNDPEILTKLEKGLAQMSTALRTFSKICGLLVVKSKNFSEIPQSRDKTSPDTSDSDESFESEPEWNTGITNWLFSKDCHWGPEHAKNVAKYAIGKNWRADSFKNVWRYVGPSNGLPVETSNRTNWEKVSMATVQQLYDSYCNELENLKECLFHNKRKNTKLWRELRCSRQRRVNNVTSAKGISLKAFRKIMQENHSEMPPLRGRKNN